MQPPPPRRPAVAEPGDRGLSRKSKVGSVRALLRLSFFVTYFTTACCCIVATQIIGLPLRIFSKRWFHAYIGRTKSAFGLVAVSLTQWFAPSRIVVSTDSPEIRASMSHPDPTTPLMDFALPHRTVVISNHQIYADWFYMWWILYTGNLHGSVYIMLKKSLQWIPLLGFGMKMYNFIFLSRSWKVDKPAIARHLNRISDPRTPMALLMYPEGTNMSVTTRAKSNAFAKKEDISPYRHVLLPRSTGLHFCLQQLSDSTQWLYDFTFGFEGVTSEEYAGTTYTLKTMYIDGVAPPGVHIYVRRFKISDIPLSDSYQFTEWLRSRWAEKDELMDAFYRDGRFPSSQPEIETKMALRNPMELAQVYVVPVTAFMLYRIPQRMHRVLSVLRHRFSTYY